jgi:hypothetical protein
MTSSVNDLCGVQNLMRKAQIVGRMLSGRKTLFFIYPQNAIGSRNGCQD